MSTEEQDMQEDRQEEFNFSQHLENPTDEQLTDEERRIVDQLRRERDEYDEQADLRERVEAKMQLMAEFPGVELDVDPDEADVMGFFVEDAMSYEDAKASAYDEHN